MQRSENIEKDCHPALDAGSHGKKGLRVKPAMTINL